MQLTIEAFKKVQQTCESFKGLDGILAEEEYRSIVEMAEGLYAEVGKAIETIKVVDEMKRSLQKAGYSDVWYDTILDSGKLDGLVQFDMPKFFDNNFNREKVCMEGFYESLAHWIHQAWEILKRFFGYIGDIIHAISEWFGVRADKETVITKGLNKVLNNAVKNILTSEPLELQGWYDFGFIYNQLTNVRKLISIFVFDDKLNRVFLNDGTDDWNVNGDQCLELFRAKLITELDMLHVDRNDPDTNGFSFKFNPGKQKFIYFFNELGGKFPQQNITIQSIGEFDNLVREVTEGPMFTLAQQISKELGKLNIQLTRQRDKMQNLVNALKNNATRLDPNQYTEAQCRVIQCNCALGIVKDFLHYMREVYRAWLNNKSLVDNTLKMAKTVGANP